MHAQAAYVALLHSGELERRAAEARGRLECCDLCGRRCRVNRLASPSAAACRTGEHAVVHSYGPHHGEEDPLRGWRGSGTLFFAGCNLRCVFCQNWEISHKGIGRALPAEEIARIMLELQKVGCHNVNLVSPSHVVAQVIEAVLHAARGGLTLPVVYNTGGFDGPEALRLLDGIVDIYMPDMKYGDAAAAKEYSKITDYVEVNFAAVREMHRQVGDLVIDDQGIARRGLLVRHLVLPEGLAGTERVAEFLATEVSRDTYLNVMDQYRPCYRADEYPMVDRRPTAREFARAVALCRAAGLHRGFPSSNGRGL